MIGMHVCIDHVSNAHAFRRRELQVRVDVPRLRINHRAFPGASEYPSNVRLAGEAQCF
jgi:hypothetical protein